MAEFMTPEQVQAQAQLLYEQHEKGYISAKQLREGLNDCAKGVKDYTQELNASLNQLGTSVKKTFENLKDGKQGAGVFKDALNSGADAASKAAMAFGPLGLAVGALLKVLTFFVTAAVDQADALYKANEDLGKVGANAGGMTEIYSNLKKFGYGISDLGDMSNLITQNSVMLSNFSGTVSQGTKKLADVAMGIQSSNLQGQLMNMGYSVDGINQGIASYMNQQSAFTTSEKKTTEQLKIGAGEYLKKLSMLSKLTGQNAADIAKQRDEALAIDAFNAALDGMTDEDRETQLERYTALAKVSKDMATGYANQVSGFTGLTKQSQQLLMTTGGVSNALAKNTKKPLGEFMQTMADATQANMGIQRSAALTGGNDMFIAYSQSKKLANMAGGQYIKAAKDSAEQTDAQAAGLDPVTDAANKTRQAQMSTRDGFENLLQKGLLPVMEGIEKLADWAESITTLGGLLGTSDRKKAKQDRAGQVAAASADGTGVAKDTAARASDVSSKLQATGFTAVEAAAITGNLYAESGFDTRAVNKNGGASGLMQWKGARLDALHAFAKERGQKWTDEATQIAFIRKELVNDKGYEAKQFKKAMEAGGGDPAKTAYYFGKYVERPSEKELNESSGKRANMAVATYKSKPLPAAEPTKPSTPTTSVAKAQKDVPTVAGPTNAQPATTGGQAPGSANIQPAPIVNQIKDLKSAVSSRNDAEKQIAQNR